MLVCAWMSGQRGLQAVEAVEAPGGRPALPGKWTLPAVARQLQLAVAAADQHAFLTEGAPPPSWPRRQGHALCSKR